MSKAVGKFFNLISLLSEKWRSQLLLIAVPILIIFVFIDLSGKIFIQPDISDYLFPTFLLIVVPLKIILMHFGIP